MPMVGWADGQNEVSDDQLFDALCAVISKRVPGFEIRYKNRSLMQRFIGFIMFWNRKYMTEFVSSFATRVYYPSMEFIKKNKWKAFQILAHEYVHLLDRQAHPIVFEMGYMLPQWLGIFALLALLAISFSTWWLCALVALLFFLPWPALIRAELEKRGYSMGVAINMWRHGSILDDHRDYLKKTFCGWNYYRMYPYPDRVEAWIKEVERYVIAVDAMRSGKTIFDISDAFQDVYELLTGVDFNDEGEGY